MDLTRPVAPDPYEILPRFPEFSLTSDTIAEGERMPDLCSGVGDNVSPHLRWEGFPPETKSFAVTCFDPDAPTPSGFWHWTVIDIPASVAEFAEGAGASDATLPAGFHVRNDANEPAWMGAAPPVGDHEHRYIFVVRALDVETLGIDPADSTPTRVAFATLFHTIAQSRLTVTYQR